MASNPKLTAAEIIQSIKQKANGASALESGGASVKLSGVEYNFDRRESIINVNNKRNNINNGIAPDLLMDSPLAIPQMRDSPSNEPTSRLIPETNAVAAEAGDLTSNAPSGEEQETNGFAKQTPEIDHAVDERGDLEDDAPIEYDYDAADDDQDLEDTIIAELRVDFFDNGPNAMAGKKKSTRYKANVHVKFPGDKAYTPFACSFNNRSRDFIATITDEQKDELWYKAILAIFDERRNAGKTGEVAYSLPPMAGKLRDSSNHVISQTVVMMYQYVGENHPRAYVAIDTFDREIVLDLPPKGKAKCPQLMAVGKYTNPDFVEERTEKKTTGVSFQQAMRNMRKQ